MTYTEVVIVKPLLKSLIMNVKEKKFKDDIQDEEAVRLFNIFSDLCRLKIVKLLLKNDDLCVSNIAEECSITVSASSQQLKLLEMGGAVRKVRKGQRICFEIRNDNKLVKKIIEIIN